MDVPVIHQYQRALDDFRRAGEASPLLKRMSELISLLDLTTTLNSALSREEILDAALLVVMGELQAARGGLFVRNASGRYELRASRGLPRSAPRETTLRAPLGDVARLPGDAEWPAELEPFGLEVVCPIVRYDRGPFGSPEAAPGTGGEAGPPARVIALLGLGPRSGGKSYGPEDRAFLRSVAACAATPIENGLMYHELRDLNQRLSVKVYQLHSLFDISRELTSTFDEEAIKNLVTSTLMGHLLVSRCALFLKVPGGLALAHQRGLRGEEAPALVPEAEARPVLDTMSSAIAVQDLAEGPLKARLLRARMALVVPLSVGDRGEGFAAVGERVSGQPFTEEDREFAQTLARQALAALESVRLHRVSLEKQRRDREMQIAREIQQSLFPACCPTIPGFEMAAESRPCYEVGGDHYDIIPVGEGRWALAIADVSGKGAPASILMASVHASLRALAGTAAPVVLMDRLNRFLYESTQESKYVTLFYAELDAVRRRLTYVNAGHVPPFHLHRDDEPTRLMTGGPVLGLLDDARYEMADVEIARGDLIAALTDGVTEALSPEDVEFGDVRSAELLRQSASAGPGVAVRRLIAAVEEWTGPAGCSDDLTVLMLKASET
jgi:sigma-B regulation protein RsbU (phosphoserine phosphatase)